MFLMHFRYTGTIGIGNRNSEDSEQFGRNLESDRRIGA
ncbi:hypothetical protein LINGRAHAP2_LOCUS31540 [Linum grandiflorum]